jgi:outer membrane protein OmpA-like peptidoglycan-associated protein
MKRTVSLLFLAVSLMGLVLGSSKKADALVDSFDVINFKPAVDSTQFITLYDADTHQKSEWNAGFYLDWAHHPLELAAPQGTRRLGVVDDTIVFNAIGSYGFTNWFTAGVRVPVVAWNNYQGLPGVIGIDPNSQNDFSLGDVGVDLKFRLLHSKYVGLAVIPFINAPTGDADVFMGQGTITGGAKFALDFNPHKRVKIGFNAGYENKDDVTIRGARIDDQILLGAAINVKPHNRIDLIAEGHTEPVARDFFKSEVQTPAEVDGAIRFHATKNIDITAGGGAGLTVGVGSPDFRAFLGLNYTHHKEEAPPPKPPKVEAKKITIDQKIHFDFDKSAVKKESYGILDDVASVLQANPQIKKVRIEGHTDSIGTDAYNQKLSERRANAVRDYLVGKGIDAGRLEAVGYGESRPIADNKTSEGRAQNRRTEFNVIEQ